MLGDAKLNSLDTRLEQFKLSNQNTQHELQALLREYSHLLESYKILRNTNTSESTKRNGVANTALIPVPEKPANPYVLVLVDGNGYIFNDELVKDKEEGGMRAARMLNDVVEKHLREHPHTKESRVVVRIYADVTNVSKQLAKTKIIGLEKRSLMPFAAGFTRALGGFDFVDSLDEEGTRFKIREAYKFAIEDNACSHILFAACHDTSYLPLLVPHEGLKNKVTLVQGAGFGTEFYQPGLTIAQFPTIFRWSDLATVQCTTKSSSITKPVATKGSMHASSPARDFPKTSALDRDNWRQKSDSVENISQGTNGLLIETADYTSEALPTKFESNKKSRLCRYFQKGFCRWGDKCSFVHVPEHVIPGAQNPSSNTSSVIDRRNVSSYLPTTIPEGFIALNKDGHRLDVFIRPPTADEWLTYNSRFHKQKPCNVHHLSGTCTEFNCPFDHHPLEVETQHCLEYVLKSSACPRRGACRDKDCFHGHICQKDGCTGHTKGCKLKADAHNADPKLGSMVPAVSVEEAARGESFGVDIAEDPWDEDAMTGW